MDDAEVTRLDDSALLEYLRRKKAPLLEMDTTKLGWLFTYAFHAYNTLERSFRDAPFHDALYTPQHQFSSFAYPRNRKHAKVPEGAGKAPDILHMALRKLGIRFADVFFPAAKELIGDEAIIRQRKLVKGKKVTMKDCPPTAEAKKVLDEAKEFLAVLKDRQRNVHRIPVPNDRTQVHYHETSYSVLETALAIREQSIEVNSGRSKETFEWIRDAFSLQSVKTIVQTQEIVRKAIERHLPGRTLEDFRLTVELHDLLQFARAVYERAHETRRDHALHEIITCDNGKAARWRSEELALDSVGESSQGFNIRSPRDAAAVLYAMPQAFDLASFAFPEEERPAIVLPSRMMKDYRRLAANVFSAPNQAAAGMLIARKNHLLQQTIERNEQLQERLQPYSEHHDPEMGIRKANRLLREVFDCIRA